MRTLRSLAAAACLLAAAPAAAADAPVTDALADLQRRHAAFAPVDLELDVSELPESERRALARIVEAARVMDPLFLRQAWAGNEALLFQLLEDTSPQGRARLALFLLHKGPWDALDHDRPFVPGVPTRPPEGSFYPAGASKAEVEAWLARLPPRQRREAQGFFTTVRRGPDGRFVAVPYSLEYQGALAEAARLLREAAALTREPTLQKFLAARADAFLSNDYYASEVAWMELDASVEPTIGPYEVYVDGWFNYKAAFEAFVTLRDDAETRKLARFSAELQDIEDHLPIAKVALAPADQGQVSFDAFFTHILMHELMHGLGPHEVKAQRTTVRQALQASSSAIEEAKADISGLWALQYLVDKGVLPRELERTMYTTFLASAFRSTRFGVNEAHGKGVALQLNHLLDAGAVQVAQDGTFRVVADKVKPAVASLTRTLMELQAAGDRRRAEELLARMGVVRPEVRRVLDRLADVPVDVAPRFTTAERLVREWGSGAAK